ncbi:ras-related protein M-Ras-like [Tigriopus californicus]|nr:ras-related protein M-Ras-like [Tigriopus californicus]
MPKKARGALPGAMSLPGDNTQLPVYRIVVVGDGGVGKSAMTLQLIQKTFVIEYDPTIEDNYNKHWEIDGKICLLNVLDTAGQEEYSAMREQFLRQGDGFLIVYSVTDTTSFERIPNFRDQIIAVKGKESLPMILVANKVDLNTRRKITEEQGLEMAQKLGMTYIETSAKDPPQNIDEAFRQAVRLIRRQEEKEEKKEKKCSIM